MADILENIVLKNEIDRYFNDEKLDMSIVTKYLNDYLVNTLNLDQNKFAVALNLINNENLNYNNRLFDVSTPNNNLFVKGITENKNGPILLFYNGKQVAPFFKIISSNKNGNKYITIETSNNPILLTNLNKRQDFNDYNYVLRTSFDCYESGKIMMTEKIYADSGNSEAEMGFIDEMYSLLQLINNGLRFKNQKLPETFNTYQSEMLNTFFDGTKNALNTNLDFNIEDIFRILNSVVFNYYKITENENFDKIETLSDIANKIVDGSIKNASFNILDNNSNPITVNVNKCKESLIVDLQDMSGSKKCNYMFYKTTQGFTFFRQVNNSKEKNIYDSFTFSLSDNVLSFSTMGNNSLSDNLTPVNMVLKIENNGEFIFNCESKANLTSNNLDLKVQDEKFKI